MHGAMKVEIENQQGNLKKHHKDYIYIFMYCHMPISIVMMKFSCFSTVISHMHDSDDWLKTARLQN